jgi:basic membrane protein A
MKQIVFLFILVCILLFSSCSKKEDFEDNKLIEKKKPHALLITDASGIGDRSFNAAAFSGLMTYYKDTVEEQKYRGVLYDVFECAANEDALLIIQQAVLAKNYQLIIAPGHSFSQALFSSAKKYPQQKFMIVDTAQNFSPNVIEFTYSEEQGSFLVGAAAALQAKFDKRVNPSFGFIGGEQSLVITKFQLGFIQGVRSILPDAVIQEYYTQAWDRIDLAEDVSRQWYADGVYAIFSAAGASSLGVINEAKKFRQRGYNVWALGVDSDQYTYGIYAPNRSAVLTSMIKDVGRAVVYSLQMMEAGNFINGSIMFDLAAEGVSFTTTNRELLPEVTASIEKIKKAILDGKLIVYGTYKEAQKAGLVKDLKYAVYE